MLAPFGAQIGESSGKRLTGPASGALLSPWSLRCIVPGRRSTASSSRITFFAGVDAARTTAKS